MTFLRSKLLSLIRKHNDTGNFATLETILGQIDNHSQGSVEATLSWLLKRKYVSVKGPKGRYHYFLTEKGLKYLRKKENIRNVMIKFSMGKPARIDV